MDTTKAKAAISTARTEIKNLVDASLKTATTGGDLRSLNGIKSLASATKALDSAEESLDSAVKRTQPKTKKAKKK